MRSKNAFFYIFSGRVVTASSLAQRLAKQEF